MKVDVYKKESTFLNWKDRVQAEGIPGLSKANTDIVIQYILDMEAGRNVANGSAKGGRSYSRLCNLTQRMTWIARMLEQRGVSDIRTCDERTALSLFSDMERGVLRTQNGTRYKSYGDYVRVFKAFWHWWQKRSKKEQNKYIVDITEDIRTETPTPPFVYISKERLHELLPYFSEDEQVVLYFVFDSLVRAPTEVLSLQARHIYERDGDVWVTIPDEVSKTFGRTLNLLYCGNALLNYIRRHNLAPEDRLFSFSPRLLTRKLQAVAVQLFGDTRSHAQGDWYRTVTLYDLRHSGAVHFRLLAKENPHCISLDAVRHRGGWADMKMLNYYTQFLGLNGKIDRQGMLLHTERHRLEEEVDVLKQELAAIRKLNAQVLALAKEGQRIFPRRERRSDTNR